MEHHDRHLQGPSPEGEAQWRTNRGHSAGQDAHEKSPARGLHRPTGPRPAQQPPLPQHQDQGTEVSDAFGPKIGKIVFLRK